jgi:hypothetical protein
MKNVVRKILSENVSQTHEKLFKKFVKRLLKTEFDVSYELWDYEKEDFIKGKVITVKPVGVGISHAYWLWIDFPTFVSNKNKKWKIKDEDYYERDVNLVKNKIELMFLPYNLQPNGFSIENFTNNEVGCYFIDGEGNEYGDPSAIEKLFK